MLDQSKVIAELIAMLQPDKHEAVIERAAICEYMGGMSRAEAEKLAWNEFANKEAKK